MVVNDGKMLFSRHLAFMRNICARILTPKTLTIVCTSLLNYLVHLLLKFNINDKIFEHDNIPQ